MSATSTLLKAPALVFLSFLALYGAVSGPRLAGPSPDNHFVHMADGFLRGSLFLDGAPPHRNDWAERDGRWFVSFPPGPAVLMLPGVAIFGLGFNDRLFTLPFAAACPALLLLLLQLLARDGRLARPGRELVALAVLFGAGTVQFFAAVQGSVWFTAHMCGGAALLGFLVLGHRVRFPLLAGACLVLAGSCRPSLLFAAPYLLIELVATRADPDATTLRDWLVSGLTRAGLSAWLRPLGLAAIPILIGGAALAAMNLARTGDPFEFGHRFLKVRWSGRIEEYGLFNWRFLGRNLGAALALVPWLENRPPYLQISTHGLALWFTTPAFVLTLWPRVRTPLYLSLALLALLMAGPSLFYQNSGWIQFGWRFSLDFTPLLILLLALSGRRFDRWFYLLVAVGILVNTFGAITFDRVHDFYPLSTTRSFFAPEM